MGDFWYSYEIDGPIMIELSELDKENIANMPSDINKYAVFDEDDPNFDTEYKKIKWMGKR